MMWTEAAISKKLGNALYSMRDRETGGPIVVDLNKVREEPPAVPAVKLVPEYKVPERRPDGYLWMEDIARVVCGVYGITRADFVSIRRKHDMVQARQVFYWLAKRFTNHSFPMIGSWCGKDHSTVIHGIEKIDTRYDEYREVLEQCAEKLGVTLDVREAA